MIPKNHLLLQSLVDLYKSDQSKEELNPWKLYILKLFKSQEKSKCEICGIVLDKKGIPKHVQSMHRSEYLCKKFDPYKLIFQ